jgi:hypothetical protein
MLLFSLCKAWSCLCFLALSLFSVLDAFYDGRLYRCGIKFSGENLNEASDDEANVASVSSPDCQQESDDDGWEEREASRTHSVKFPDDVDQDHNKEVSSHGAFCNHTRTLRLNPEGYI